MGLLLQVIVQFQPSSVPDEWGTTQDGQTRPRVVKRGIDDDHDEVPDGTLPLLKQKSLKHQDQELRIRFCKFPFLFCKCFLFPTGELPTVDHLVFMVHGIGPVCDLRFRSMIECGERHVLARFSTRI